MNKRLLTCILALALVCAFAFSASAVSRYYAADAIAPFDPEIYTSSEFTQPEIPEDPSILIYGYDETIPEFTLPDVASEPEKAQLPVKGIVICVVIALVIALIVTLSVKSSYKPVRRRSDAAEYLVDGSLRVTASDESFVRSERRERTIENKSSSGE